MPDRREILFNCFLIIGVVLLLMEIIEAITGIPYFAGIGILGWPFFLGGIVGRAEESGRH
ncbi:MAG: hypothetical protein ACXADO_07450 [Candidatus Thorarchaeota archaeon]|jgi:hypothetical protein